MSESRSPDLARTIFTVFVICGLAAMSLWILRPFLMAIVWATMIVIPTWPLMLRLQKWLGDRRGRAVAAMTLLLLATVFVPLLLAMMTVARSADDLAAKIGELKTSDVPPPPSWLSDVPVVGKKASARWQEFAGENLADLKSVLTPYTQRIAGWMKAHLGGVAGALGHFLLTVIVASMFYANGESAADRVRRFARRLGGERGDAAVVLAGMTVKSIALGVVVTAVLQAVACGAGLAIAGVPLAGFLTVAMLILCIAQIGPLLVMAPAVAWVFSTGNTGWGVFLLVWAIVFGLMDNVLRPVLIRKGVDLPLFLIFAGVIGGLLTIGLIGIFIGPVILAVAQRLLSAWIDRPDESAATAEAAAGGS